MSLCSRIKPALVGFVILLAGFGYDTYKIETSIGNSARSRVTTVSQRCELTGIVLAEAKNPTHQEQLEKSLKGCYAQLIKVKDEATQ